MSRASDKAKARQKKRGKVNIRRKRTRGKYKTATAKKKSKSRNYNRRYLQLIARVRLICRYRCAMCDVKSTKLQCHHIRQYSTHALLRANIKNLIMLCNKCHKSIRGREDQFRAMFTRRMRHNIAQYKKHKWTYDDLLKEDRENELLPVDFVPFVYKDAEQLKIEKVKENYLSKLYRGIKSRCYNKKNKSYNNYGGRGIQMYQEWLDDRSKFIEWIVGTLGERPSKNHSLDRIDGNGNYEPGNLRWASDDTQAYNRRTTKFNQHEIEVIFILYHRYKYKQSELMYLFNLTNVTAIRNICKGKTFTQFTNKYISIVKEQEVLDRLNEQINKGSS